VLVVVIQLEKQVGILYGVHTGYCMGGGSVQSLVANDDTEF
jgi:hypothetical protein